MALALQPKTILDQEHIMAYTLPLDHPEATLENVGGKGASLARLMQAGMPVPDGFHVTTAAYRRFVQDNALQPVSAEALKDVAVAQPGTLEAASSLIRARFLQAQLPADIAAAIKQSYEQFDEDTAVAVRSSATAEDLPELSFAGQQDTFLNVRGVTTVQESVKHCWASLWTARAIGYRAQHGIDHDVVSLAVVVQQLVNAEASGVMFTANPITGRRDQAVINAAWGLGEAIVGGLVTPDTIVVEKATGKVIERQTADKQVMIVRSARGTIEQAVPDRLRQAAVLSDRQAAQLVQLGVQIDELYGMPMDIEWTWAAGEFAIVQARPITALPEPTVTAPTEWKLPDPKGKYLRASIVDLMPDPVSPLFATLGLGALSSGMKRAMSELTKSSAAIPHDYVVTINSYAYQNSRMDGRMTWWLLTRMLPHLPKMLRSGLQIWRETVYPRYVETVQRWEDKSPADLSSIELLDSVREIMNAAMHSLGWQLSWMGAAAGSEALFTRVYERLVRRKDDPAATTFVMGYNSDPIRAEKSLYDLALWCRAHAEISTFILNTPSDQIARSVIARSTLSEAKDDDEAISASFLAMTNELHEFQVRFRAHLREFGHLIYDLDFAKPLPLDDPTPMLETIKMYLRGEGVNPHERQQLLETKRVQAVENTLGRIKGLKRWAFIRALNWAQPLAGAREDGLAAIGLGYPLVRQQLHELGYRLVAAKVIEQPDDIFWLREEELEQAVADLMRGETFVSIMDRIEERRNFSRAVKRITPPPVLPPSKTVWGVKVDSFTAADESSQTGNTLKGAATSTGKVTAPARVLRGPEDFDQMRPGDVLVAGTTTPAWTPLFAMAAAVVTDIGGPLSHGSIVAREYGIPAVMGTGVATKRIRSGQIITVDGNAGTVTLT